MSKKRTVMAISLLIMLGTLSVVAAFPFVMEPGIAVVKDYTVVNIKPPNPGGGKGDVIKTEIHVRNLGHGDIEDHLRIGAEVNVIAQVFGSNDVTVDFSIDNEYVGPMFRIADWQPDRELAAVYKGTWWIDPLKYFDGYHTVTVTGNADFLRKPIEDTHEFKIVSIYEAELWYEIDYMEGFIPDPIALEYWADYWDDHAILVHYTVDQSVPWNPSLTMDDFWSIEVEYNSNSLGAGMQTEVDGWYTRNTKWMLWADHMEDPYNPGQADPYVGGFTYVAIDLKKGRCNSDMLGGDYSAIFKGMIEESYSETDWVLGGEACVAMHEAGHSIGISMVNKIGNECYDSDSYSVMSYMSNDNAMLTDNWFYSWFLWGKRNIGYY